MNQAEAMSVLEVFKREAIREEILTQLNQRIPFTGNYDGEPLCPSGGDGDLVDQVTDYLETANMRHGEDLESGAFGQDDDAAIFNLIDAIKCIKGAIEKLDALKKEEVFEQREAE